MTAAEPAEMIAAEERAEIPAERVPENGGGMEEAPAETPAEQQPARQFSRDSNRRRGKNRKRDKRSRRDRRERRNDRYDEDDE